MQVLHVISALQLGGAEKVAIDLAIQHVRSGGKCSVAAIRRPSSPEDPLALHYYDVLTQAGIEFFELGRRNSRKELMSLPLKLSGLIQRLKPDLVHSHTDIPDFVVSGARRIRRFEVARTIHNTSLWPTHWWAGFIAEQGFRDDLIVSVSDDALKAYRNLRNRYHLRASTHLNVIRNGVHVRPLDPAQPAEHRSGTMPLRIAYFGRSNADKGLDVLLEAVRSHAGKGSALELSIFSDAAFKPDFQRRVAEIPRPLRLLPPVPNAWELMNRFDLVVIPSRVEGLPLVALEALASGTPVIVTRIPGLREAVPPEWPLSVPPNDPAALAAMLEQVTEGSYDLAELRRAGHRFVREQTVEATFQRYKEVYSRYLSR